MRGFFLQSALLLQAYLTLAAPSPQSGSFTSDSAVSLESQPVYQVIVSAPGTKWDKTNVTLKNGSKGPSLGYTPAAPPYLFVPIPANITGDTQVLATYNPANKTTSEYLTLAGPGGRKQIQPVRRPRNHNWPAHYGVGWKGWKIDNGTIVYDGPSQIGGAINPKGDWYAVEDGKGGFDLTYGTEADISALSKRWSWKKFFKVALEVAKVVGPILLG